jgi:hypothetical protein
MVGSIWEFTKETQIFWCSILCLLHRFLNKTDGPVSEKYKWDYHRTRAALCARREPQPSHVLHVNRPRDPHAIQGTIP